VARKNAVVKITDDNRDKGKAFLITEMSATQGEAWAMRAILALMAGDVELPEGFERMGMAGIAEVGLKALSGLHWEVAEPLLADMMACVQFIPDPLKQNVLRDLFEEDIEEISTRVKLKAEVWKLHTDFLQAATPSNSGQLSQAGSGKKHR
jgi:hypothetical protein